MSAPWGINHIHNMVSGPGIETPVNGKWVGAVPVPYRKNLFETVRAAWWVLTGRAEAVVWPEAGELEAAISGHNPATSEIDGNGNVGWNVA